MGSACARFGADSESGSPALKSVCDRKNDVFSPGFEAFEPCQIVFALYADVREVLHLDQRGHVSICLAEKRHLGPLDLDPALCFRLQSPNLRIRNHPCYYIQRTDRRIDRRADQRTDPLRSSPQTSNVFPSQRSRAKMFDIHEGERGGRGQRVA